MSEELLTWPHWSLVDDRGLARYVTPQASRWLPLPINQLDVSESERQKIIVTAIYNALTERDIRYSLEEYHPSNALQTIRTPSEVLVAPRQGTCLDLAVLFCGLCESYELLPLLILLEGHALAAISLTHGLRDWNARRPGHELFASGPLTSVNALRGLIDANNFLAIECTGFAHSEHLGNMMGDWPEAQRRNKGVLSFDEAAASGRRQLDLPGRPFLYALDVATAHYGWRIEPYKLEQLPGAYITNIFRLLTEAPAPLLPHLKVLDFERLVKERTHNFVGRTFIFSALDSILRDPEFPSGYILIRGEPGIGKTALISQLVKTRGYVHHFNISPQNIRSARAFLENVCAQLIVRYNLDYPTLPLDAAKDSAFLSQLLAEATEKSAGNAVVITVDALDEVEDTGLHASANRLFLPPALPPNVYFVLSSREQIDYRLNVDRRKDLHLQDEDPQNLDDVRVFILNFIDAHPEMERRIAAWKIEIEEFLRFLTERSQGNFMYLVHVLEDIRTGHLSSESIGNLDGLPKGLREYYERHWRSMRAHDVERFERIYEPVLRVLATVREPVDLGALEKWTGVDPARIREVIREWRQFLNEMPSSNGEHLFRIYHASFQDFLAEEGMGLKPWHRRIADVALAKVPGLRTRA